MAEDSGAFKTNQAYLRPIWRFVIGASPLLRRITARKSHHPTGRGDSTSRFLRKRRKSVAVSSNQP
jgi:hypothetical protein